MRKLKLQMQTSVDGFVAGPVDTIVLGRKLYEGFVPAWEERVAKPDADWFTHKMVDTTKIVFSHTLKEVKGTAEPRSGRAIPLKLAGSESYDCGIVVNSYNRK